MFHEKEVFIALIYFGHFELAFELDSNQHFRKHLNISSLQFSVKSHVNLVE
jgi:hypothetical protein